MSIFLRKYDGVPLFVRPDSGVDGTLDNEIAKEVICRDCYSVRDTFFGQDYPTIIDVGGHIGSFSSLCRLRWPHANIVSFEPSSENFSVLKKNSAERFEAFNVAITGDSTGVSELGLRVHGGLTNTGGYTLGRTTSNKSYQSVLMVPLAEICRPYDRIDLLKIDAEGAEFDILFNSPIWFMKRISRIRMELHSHGQQMAGCSYEDLFEKVFRFFEIDSLSPTSLDEIGDSDLQIVYLKARTLS